MVSVIPNGSKYLQLLSKALNNSEVICEQRFGLKKKMNPTVKRLSLKPQKQMSGRNFLRREYP